MTRSEIERLEERVNELSCGPEDSLLNPDFWGEPNNSIRAVWRRLHWTRAEVEEHDQIEAQRTIMIRKLHEGYVMTEEDYEEGRERCRRLNELRFNIQEKRLQATDKMMRRIWPDLAARVLKLREFPNKPDEALTPDERKELETLLDWFSELQREVLQTCSESTIASNPRLRL